MSKAVVWRLGGDAIYSSAPNGAVQGAFIMQSNDEAVVRAFIERLENGELNGKMNRELAKLSYEQLLRVSQILGKRVEKEREK